MRFQGWLALVVVGLLTAADTQDAARQDLARFQGRWVLRSAERDGKQTPGEEVQKFRLTIHGDKFVLSKDTVVVSEGTFTLDPTKKPKEIDETATAGPSKGKTFLAVYEIDDEQHKICFAAPGKDRPTEFSSTPGSGRLLQVWKREKK
jgi:uncharacterized protein (TIGR03067 family)